MVSEFMPRRLPPGLESLTELALDLRWTWNHATDHLWRALDPGTWEQTRNPWIILQNVPGERLQSLAADGEFQRLLAAILDDRHSYQGSPLAPSPPTAYFSMEFGIGEALPLYAGGLGVLAGDHLKAASDLGVPMIGVGLLYQEGYFRQALDAEGRQHELFPYNDPTALPIRPVRADGGSWVRIAVDLPGRTIWLRAWQAAVGRVTLYLLDSNVPVNDPVDRGITGKLYDADPETRLCQEIVLGIGGWKLIDALGIQVGACHLNEGHAALVILERARSVMKSLGLSFSAALWATRAGTVFTSHTPVAAGFDAFSPDLVARYFPDGRGYLAELGISLQRLLGFGRVDPADGGEPFRPAFLAIRGAGHVNGVSRLHGETCRRIFQPLFPRWPEVEVPVDHVTNGVHVPTWDSRWSDEIWTAACGRDRWLGSPEDLGAVIERLDDDALWKARGCARAELVERARGRLARQLARRGATADAVDAASRLLDPDILTIGFARRFADYKRPNLLLRDPERLRRLLNDDRTPVQLLVAGKAHPADGQGKALVESWVRFAGEPAVRKRCVFLEDYDLSLAQELVQGVDVWMNTPRRPWEACGTSGMKVLVNGGLNLSVQDGWWVEAYEPDVGWSIRGRPESGETDVDADERDTQAIFSLLEGEIVPLFYRRDPGGLPRDWLRRVRASLSRLTPRFSANRMLGDYATRRYRPAADELARRMAGGGTVARALDDWTNRLVTHWPLLRFGRLDSRPTDAGWEISVEVYLDDLQPNDVTVELYADPISAHQSPVRIPMASRGALPGTSHGQLFAALASRDRPASSYTPRIIPASTSASIPLELPLIAWQR
jgi:starch phosphorylase